MQRGRSLGFSFAEMVVATAVGALFFGYIIFFASATRTQTSKAENYLRALQIAQETIELVQSTPGEALTPNNMQLFEGSLVNPQTGRSIALPVHGGAAWKPTTQAYPDQYANAYFLRKVTVEPVEQRFPNARFLKRVTVEVFWNEGKAPDRIEAIGGNPDRMRKLSLAAIIFDEKEGY